MCIRVWKRKMFAFAKILPYIHQKKLRDNAVENYFLAMLKILRYCGEPVT